MFATHEARRQICRVPVAGDVDPKLIAVEAIVGRVPDGSNGTGVVKAFGDMCNRCGSIGLGDLLDSADSLDRKARVGAGPYSTEQGRGVVDVPVVDDFAWPAEIGAQRVDVGVEIPVAQRPAGL